MNKAAPKWEKRDESIYDRIWGLGSPSTLAGKYTKFNIGSKDQLIKLYNFLKPLATLIISVRTALNELDVSTEVYER